MAMTLDLEGRTSLVTGGTRGIGLAIVECLVGAGARVIATGTGDEPSAGIARMQQEGQPVEYRALDLASETSVETFCARVAIDPVDVLVNNAGVNQIVPVHDVQAPDYDRLHRINLRGPLLLAGAVVPGMRERGWGRIINIASIWATITKPGRAMYTASKFGLVGLTKTLAVENAEYGILVNAVSPGFTLTELTRSTLRPEEIESLAADVPVRRFADPVEMARVVAFLASPQNSYLTAQNITVDGGYTTV